MNATIVRAACVLALSTSTGCADLYFSYVEDASLPMLVQDVGTGCDGDDVFEDIARVTIEQVDANCVITADVLVRVIEYQDIVDDLAGFDLNDAVWEHGGICEGASTEDDEGQADEKCDYRPMVTASWRLVGETDWSPNPEFPDDALADLSIAYYPGPVDTLDDVSGEEPSLEFSTSGMTFPGGIVNLEDSGRFFTAFDDAVPEDLYSVAHVRVEVPMSDIAKFAEHEYKVDFAYQMYVQGYLPNQDFWSLFWDTFFGGGDEA